MIPFPSPDTTPPVLVADEMEKEKAGPDAADILAAAVKATRPVRTEKKERQDRQEKQQEVSKDILIRQILEEFMA